MDEIAAILAELAPLLPAAGNLIAIISGNVNSPVPALAALAASLLPIAEELVTRIENIRSATEAQYPAIWGPIKDDWIKTWAAWEMLQETNPAEGS